MPMLTFVDVQTLPAKELVLRLELAGVRMLATGPTCIRAVTSLMVSAEQIQKTLEIVGRVMPTCSPP